jgi:peptidoglycan/LPS O-acetylase OafA/YrhL
MGVACITMLLTHAKPGRGVMGYIRFLLEAPIFTIIGRLTYSIYLIHLPIMYWNMAHWTHRTDFVAINIVHAYMGYILFSVLGATGLYLLVSA